MKKLILGIAIIILILCNLISCNSTTQLDKQESIYTEENREIILKLKQDVDTVNNYIDELISLYSSEPDKTVSVTESIDTIDTIKDLSLQVCLFAEDNYAVFEEFDINISLTELQKTYDEITDSLTEWQSEAELTYGEDAFYTTYSSKMRISLNNQKQLLDLYLDLENINSVLQKF